MTPPISDQNDDQRLAALISDAVADVEPADRLSEIREQTSTRRFRHGWYAVGGAAVAAAAVVTAVALLGNQTTPQADGPPIADPPSPTASTATGPATPVYYVGETTHGTRLFRYFEPANGRSPLEILSTKPADPDYRTLWPTGSLRGLGDPESGQSVVLLDPSVPLDRPQGMTGPEAELAIQQVVYSVRAHYQEDIDVQFKVGTTMVDSIYGVPTTPYGGAAPAPPLEVLSLVSISDPAEREVVSGTFKAKGVANSYEANVPWEIRLGDNMVLNGFATAAGSMEPKLFEWETEVDVSTLEPGTYTFVAMTSDPSGGTEGPGPYFDTRTIVVE